MTPELLMEKLGFRIMTFDKFFTLVYKNGGRHTATAEEIALWNLCLELSERQDLILECLRDRDLPDGAKLQAIGILVSPKREPTEKEIAYAKTLEPVAEKEKKA